MPRRTLARSSRTRDEEDEREEEETTSRRRSTRRGRDDDEGERRPRRSSGRSRSRDDDDDDDDRPSRRRAGKKDKRGGSVSSTTAGRGRAMRKKTKASRSKFSDDDRFDVAEVGQRYLVKVMDDEPYAYDQHWLKELEGTGEKVGHVCLGDDCPPCDILSDKPKDWTFWNVVDMNGAQPELRYWMASSSPSEAMDDLLDDLESKDKSLTDPDVYVQVRKVAGKNKINLTHVELVKARDLDEDWEVEPLTEDELETFEDNLFDPEEYVRKTPRKELMDICEDLED